MYEHTYLFIIQAHPAPIVTFNKFLSLELQRSLVAFLKKSGLKL